MQASSLCDVEAEQRLLGAILMQENLLPSILSEVRITPDIFILNSHRTAFNCFLDLLKEGKEINLLTVSLRISECNLSNICSQSVLADAAAVGTLNVSLKTAIAHAQTVCQYWQQRQFITLLTDSAEKLAQATGNYLDLRAEVATQLTDFLSQLESQQKSNLHYLDVEVKEVVKGIVERMGQEDAQFPGVKPALLDLESYLPTFTPGQSIVLAARPSIGKSALALKFTFEAIKQKRGAVVFFSAEMTYEELITRLVSLHSKIPLSYLTNNKILTPEEIESLEESYNYLSNLKKDRRFLIEDTPGNELTFSRIEATLTQAQIQQESISLVVFDYLQLIAGDWNKEDNRNLVVTRWSQYFKAIAKKYHCPVIVVSQLHRGVESRSDKRPLLSDLRDSGSIEQDADVVLLLYRSDYYNNQQNSNYLSELEINVAKNRNGATGTATVLFKRDTQEFLNLAKQEDRI